MFNFTISRHGDHGPQDSSALWHNGDCQRYWKHRLWKHAGGNSDQQDLYGQETWEHATLTLTGPIAIPVGFTVTTTFGSTHLAPGAFDDLRRSDRRQNGR